MFHVGGLCIQTLPALFVGAQVVVHARFDPGETLACIARERPTLTLQVPPTMQALIEHPAWPSTDLSSLRALWAGSSVIPASVIEPFHARGVPVCNVYGATETYGNCSVTDAHDPLPLKLSTQGLPLPGMTIRAVDPASRAPLPAGEIGELAVRGYTTPGYFRAPELDAEAFDDGWFLTGDLGSIEPDGRVRFRGRLKEMIKTGGINVAPREIEEFLGLHPEVAAVAVVGVPDERLAEVPVAFVVAREGAAPAPADLLAFCRERIAAYKVPARVHVVPELPATDTGKLARRRLVELDRIAEGSAAA